MVVIEHNLEVIRQADYIIDLGPGAGDEGGYLVATGTPEEIQNVSKSHTGKFLKAYEESLKRRKMQDFSRSAGGSEGDKTPKKKIARRKAAVKKS